VPIFWSFFGAFAGVVVGSLSGAYLGLQTINATVRTEFWAGKTDVFRASYYVGYGGNGVVAGLLGFIETSWILSYLALASALVSVPYYILSNLREFIGKAFGTSANQIELSYRLLGHGFLLAFASWMSAWASKLSIERLLQWYDKQNTNPAATNTDVTNDTALIFDFVNHEFMTIAYHVLAWIIASCSWGYIYGQLTDESLKN
jgi:hypothetical protein